MDADISNGGDSQSFGDGHVALPIVADMEDFLRRNSHFFEHDLEKGAGGFPASTLRTEEEPVPTINAASPQLSFNEIGGKIHVGDEDPFLS